jgi:hypothetical protein
MTIMKAAAVTSLLLLGGCSWFGGSDKLACDPSLPANFTVSREPPPPGFAAPTLMAPPCAPATKTKTADGGTLPDGAPPPPDPLAKSPAALAGR